MLTGTTIFTGLVAGSDVSGTLTQYAYLFGGLILVMFALSPLFIAKGGFQFILRKVTGLFGSR